ncbi:PAAR domain-containing protein [Burkholderia gladioli]|uniref:PAAR domain-containing protein n=1 Tax=Burkholderia gladioli TaxID=28095 RepID=UPI00163E6D33|nr:PAAR domain-containing protein [Burkholderia gladioli]
MIDFIRLGDTLEHGGQVLAASQTMNFDGKAVARKGDKVDCRKHPGTSTNVIEEGDATMTDGGIPIARHGHRASCGCRLISSLV